jgi:threonyl-tRNA synthetase
MHTMVTIAVHASDISHAFRICAYSAHVLGLALEHKFGAHLCVGPAIEDGFYYDVYVGGAAITPGDNDGIQSAFDQVSISRRACLV